MGKNYSSTLHVDAYFLKIEKKSGYVLDRANMSVLLLGCGHCKRLAPVYDEVGKAFKNEPNVSLT